MCSCVYMLKLNCLSYVVRFLWKVGSPYLFERSKMHKITPSLATDSSITKNVGNSKRSSVHSNEEHVLLLAKKGSKSAESNPEVRNPAPASSGDQLKKKQKYEGVIWE